MLLDLGLMSAAYVVTKLFDKYKNSQKIQVTKKNQALLTASKVRTLITTPLANDFKSPTNKETKKEYDHYLKISAASMGLVLVSIPFTALHLVSLGVITYTAIPIFKKVEKSLQEKKIGHEMLLVAIISLALVTGQFVALSITILFFHLGRKNLAKIKDNSSKKIFFNLTKYPSEDIWILKDRVEIKIPLESVQINDIIVINTGETIPIDGTIIEGVAMVDQHTLTGESRPSEKEMGNTVFSSTIVVRGRICIKVEKTGKNTSISKVHHILNQTVSFESSTQLNAEKWSNKIAIPLLGVSALALPILGSIHTSAILNITFGDRLRATAPVGMLNHIEQAFHQGILIKDGRAMELLNQIDTVIFDKTGTLTEEVPKVGSIILCNDDYDENDLLRYATAAEGKLIHPIAKALSNETKERNLILPNLTHSHYHIGLGITVSIQDKVIQVGSHRFMTLENIVIPKNIKDAMLHSHNNGHSLIMIAVNHELQGMIEIQSSIRPEVKKVIAGLRRRGIKYIAIVSGDQKEPTRKLAELLRLDGYYYNISPENKGNIVEKLQDEGKMVCFVGDGINDAVAIKKANVSISLKGASYIATDLAQVILMDGNLSQLCHFFDLTKSLEKNFKQILKIIVFPSALNIVGGAFLNFNLLSTVIVNNIAFLFALSTAKKTTQIKPIIEHKNLPTTIE